MSTLIALCIVRHARRLQKTFDHKVEQPYQYIAVILLESSSLYTVWSIISLVLFATGSNGSYLIGINTMLQIETISQYLVILRVAKSVACRSKADEKTMASSSLHFAPSESKVVLMTRSSK